MSLSLAASPCAAEWARDVRYPISRWYARPLAVAIAARGAQRGWHANWFTGANLAIALLAALAITLATPAAWLCGACGVWLAWLCDRIDGALARASRTESAWGAWLDGNIDEATDLAWHAAVAWAAMTAGYSWAGGMFAAFVSGKYLFLHSLQAPAGTLAAPERQASDRPSPQQQSLLAVLYHLPANADIRLHLLLAALLLAAWHPVWLVLELTLCAAYYHLRWLARYVLVYRRLSSLIPHPSSF